MSSLTSEKENLIWIKYFSIIPYRPYVDFHPNFYLYLNWFGILECSAIENFSLVVLLPVLTGNMQMGLSMLQTWAYCNDHLLSITSSSTDTYYPERNAANIVKILKFPV